MTFSDAFWAPRLETVRTVTIAATFKQSEDTGRIKNFEIAGGDAAGEFCSRYAFDDSDVYKIIEGASYALAVRPDPALDGYLDTLIAKIAKAQEPDGYLYTARTINPAKTMADGGEGAVDRTCKDSHELYNLGHLYEAAVAHFQATGKRTLLDVATKSADLIARTFGPAGAPRIPRATRRSRSAWSSSIRATGDPKYLGAGEVLPRRARQPGRPQALRRVRAGPQARGRTGHEAVGPLGARGLHVLRPWPTSRR